MYQERKRRKKLKFVEKYAYKLSIWIPFFLKNNFYFFSDKLLETYNHLIKTE